MKPWSPTGAQNQERPSIVEAPPDEVWGSDFIAAVVQSLGIPYIALVPGSSYRGLHDSIVNFLGNQAPEIVLTIHEETAVAVAHGYAKVTERPMATALHANVGLMHGMMGVFNAWCDRAPLLLLGATGPVDAARRRPWIDWIHTSADQGALVRDFTKWDNQPGSAAAAGEALLRAVQIARTAPRGPVYVNFDVSLQEGLLTTLPSLPDVARFAPPSSPSPAPAALADAAARLSAAARPVILCGRVSRSEDAWAARVALAEALDAPVLTSLLVAASFPTDHPLHAAPPGLHLSREAERLVEEADVILSLDWPDLAGTIRQACRSSSLSGQVIHVSCDAHNHRGWSADHQGLPPVDVYLLCEPDAAVPGLLQIVTPRPRARIASRATRTARPTARRDDALTLSHVAAAVTKATCDRPVCYTRLPLAWPGGDLAFRHPLDYLGHDGGAGIGSGPGMSVGAALALRGSGRIPIALLGDGDFLMGNTAVWTAVHSQIPLLIVVCNNQSFFNDEQHQRRIAARRGRPTERSGVGQRLDQPAIDVCAMARAQGALAIGPIRDAASLDAAMADGVAAVAGGGVCVIDVRVPGEHDAVG